MDSESRTKSTAEQGIASWINYLNQLRLDLLSKSLDDIGRKTASELENQSENYKQAIHSIDQAIKDAYHIIESNRGGTKGIHGYIAEAAQKGVGNAKSYITGGCQQYEWVNDNGQWDIIKLVSNGKRIPVQVKFTQKLLSLPEVLRHLEKYPDSVQIGGYYMIPKDFYEQFNVYADMPASIANKLPSSNGEFNLADWEYVQNFVKEGKIPRDRIMASDLSYKDVQSGQIFKTLDAEKNDLKKINDVRNKKIEDEAEQSRRAAFERSKPSLKEGAKVAAASAAIEGVITLVSEVIKKRKDGKRLKDFTEEDWKEILSETGIGTLKGSLRGVFVYTLTNCTHTPASVANALVTASFGVARLLAKYRANEISELEFYENCEIVCLDAAVSALSSFMGQALVPVPVIGAILGNAVGTLMYQIGMNLFRAEEKKSLERYLAEIEELDSKLSEEYRAVVETLNEDYCAFIKMVQDSFSVNAVEAFNASVKLAKSLGISDEDVLDTVEKRDAFFLA